MLMKMIKSTSIDKIERELAGLNRSRDRLRSRVESTATALASATESRRRILIDIETDESPDLTKAEQSVRTAGDRHAAAADALACIEAQVVATESKLAAERDRAEREHIAAELGCRADAVQVAANDLLKKVAPLGQSYAQLKATISAFGLLLSDFGIPVMAEDHARMILFAALRGVAPGVLPPRPDGSLSPLQHSADAAEVAAALQIRPLRTLAERILSGEAAAAIPEPQEQFIQITIPTTSLILSESVSWRDIAGNLVQANEGGAELPVPVAEAAVARGIGFSFDHPRGAQILEALRVGYATGANKQSDIVRRGPPWNNLGVNLYEWAEAERARLREASEE